jgi:predicted dehydrogenase
LQVGHLERFNAAYQAFLPHFTSPLMIEMQRLASFKKRGSEVDVILDLMIHDLDILLSWVNSPILEIKANGLSMITNDIDLANVSIKFENQCVANLTASRVHPNLERLTRVYQDKDYFVLNYQEQQLTRYIADPNANNNIYLIQEQIACEKKDALKEQIAAFVDSILHARTIQVDGQAGLNALEIALHIQSLIHLPQEVNHFV